MDAPYLLADPLIQAERQAALAQAHVAPLVRFVSKLRSIRPDCAIPDFDPFDGGINAECLLLLQAPGPKSVLSGFISRNNPDSTAKNFFELNQEAGLARTRTVVWNAEPWQVPKVKSADLRSAEPYLEELLTKLPKLRAVVLFGGKGQEMVHVIQYANDTVKIFECWLPATLALNSDPHRRSEILECLVQVRQYLAR